MTAEPLTHSDLAVLIARHLRTEARLTAKHARCYTQAGLVCAEIRKLAPAPKDCKPADDPHYWARVRAGKWLDRGNEAIQTAKAVTKKRKGLEVRLGVLEARSAVKAWADPFGEVACA